MTRGSTHNAGRKRSTERIRELVAILGSLSKQGDRVTLTALCQRLGLSHTEASNLMSIVCQASGKEYGGLLVSANDDMSEFTLEYPAIHGRPIRLTASETIALVHALDLVGISENDSLRKRLQSAFSSDEVNAREVRKALGVRTNADIEKALMTCAQSQAESRMISFDYRGLADDQPRQRCVLVRRLRMNNNCWLVDAHDLDRLADRTFRVDRMNNVTLGTLGRLPHKVDDGPHSTRLVKVKFTDVTYLTLFDWNGLCITRSTPSFVEGTLPYYGPRSDWLTRRIIACGGALLVEDECIMHQAKEYARILLESKELSGNNLT